MAQFIALREAKYRDAEPIALKGAIVQVRASGEPWGGDEPFYFIMIDVPAFSIDAVVNYSRPYRLDLSWNVESFDENTDTYQLRIEGNANTSQTYGLSLAQIEHFITMWSGTVLSNGTNYVVIEANILTVLTSRGFWDMETNPLYDSVVFSELAYDVPSRTHTIEIDYSAIQISPTHMERLMHRKGAEIVSHADRVLTVNMTSADARAAFQDEIKRRTSSLTLLKTRYYVDPIVVDEIIAEGGTRTTTPATALTYVRDVMND